MTSIAGIPEQARLAWVVDVDKARAESIATQKGCNWATSLEPALADPSVQVVVVASTTDTHFPFIMQSLNANKSVLTEKPISHEMNEVEEAVQLATSKDLPLYCGYQRRCDKNFRALKKHLDDGSVGDLKVIKCCSRDNPVPPMEYLRTSGGIFHDMLIHDFDMLNWLSGGHEPESVMSVGHAYNEEIEEMGDIDTVAVMLKYPNGLLAMVDTCRDASYGYDQRIEAFGAKGMLTARNELTSTVELATSDGHLMPCAQWSFPQRYKDAYTTELNEFITMVRAGRGSEHHRLEQEAMSRHPSIVRTTIAAELSWKLGRSVDLRDLEGLLLNRSEKGAASETRSTCDSSESGTRSPRLETPSLDDGRNMLGDTFRKYEDSCRQEEEGEGSGPVGTAMGAAP
jgi:myo-inositol 2-dehydrogenase/D-chiro-inositol 1-dehydrogenase